MYYEIRTQVNLPQPIKRCHITLEFYAPDKRKADLTNKAESIMDVLVLCEVLEDDNWNVVPQVSLIFKCVDRDNPRCIVTITEI